MAQRKPAARTATSGDVAAQLLAKKPRPKRGVRAGLKDGEIRVTIVLSDDLNQVLHDWAKTNNRTFREVSMAMAERYVEEVVRPFAKAGGKLQAPAGVEIPERYASFYAANEQGDQLARFDKYAR